MPASITSHNPHAAPGRNARQAAVMPQEFVKKLNVQPFAGYLPGMHQPAVVADLACAPLPVPHEALRVLDAQLRTALAGYGAGGLPAAIDGHPLLRPVVQAVAAALRQGGMPVFSEGALLGAPTNKVVRLALPAVVGGYAATGAALDWAVAVLNAALAGLSIQPWLDGWPALLHQIGAEAPQGMNSLRFIEAAHAAGVPWSRLSNNVFQFGWGAQARWLDSSFTDQTPSISTQMARDKVRAAQVLFRAQIPVPAHALAADPEAAVALARRLGYPVVVKPADQDGGRGVSAGLTGDAAVRKAYVKAGAFSRRVLVEKHFTGNDYRLQVFQGEVFWAVHRVPGGVTGDASHSIAELLAITNADPRRGAPGSNALLKQIDVDEEAREMLLEQGLTLDSRLAQGQFVPLRRAANVASGGLPVPVLETAHPDNLALAVRAARILRLDLAGVDLLIPDIRNSWLESGAVICEVNAQPQMSPHLPALVLKNLVRGEGRIPVVMVLGATGQEAWFGDLARALGAGGRCVGVATPNGVRIGMEQVSGPCGLLQGMRALLADPAVKAALVALDCDALPIHGAPVDRFDALVLAGPPGVDANPTTWREWEAVALDLASRAGQVLVDPACPQWAELGESLGTTQWTVVARTDMAAALAQLTKEAGP